MSWASGESARAAGAHERRAPSPGRSSEPPRATTSIAARSPAGSATRSLRRYARPSAPCSSRSDAVARVRGTGSARRRRRAGCVRRSRWAMRMPSSSPEGGMRTSVTTTSRASRSTTSSSSSPCSQIATTSTPAAAPAPGASPRASGTSHRRPRPGSRLQRRRPTEAPFVLLREHIRAISPSARCSTPDLEGADDVGDAVHQRPDPGEDQQQVGLVDEELAAGPEREDRP